MNRAPWHSGSYIQRPNPKVNRSIRFDLSTTVQRRPHISAKTPWHGELPDDTGRGQGGAFHIFSRWYSCHILVCNLETAAFIIWKGCMIAAPHKGTRLSTLGPQNLNRSARQGDETTLDNLGVNMYTTCVYVCLYVCLSVCMCVCLSVWVANFLGDYVLELVHQLIVRWQSDYCSSAFVTGSQQLGVLSQKGHRYESPLAMESISMIYTLTSRLHAIRTPHARLTMSFVRRRNL